MVIASIKPGNRVVFQRDLAGRRLRGDNLTPQFVDLVGRVSAEARVLILLAMAPRQRRHPDDHTNKQFPYHTPVYNPPCFPQSERVPLRGQRRITQVWALNQGPSSTHGCAKADSWSPPAIVRPARSQANFHRRRRAEGLSAWPAPNIVDWKTFARAAWEDRNLDGRLLLNPAQEQSLWSEIIHSEQHLPTALPASVRRLAAMAMEAHDLLCSYAPQFLRASSRVGWDQDAGAFSKWLACFDEHCGKNGLVSQSRVPLDLIIDS